MSDRIEEMLENTEGDMFPTLMVMLEAMAELEEGVNEDGMISWNDVDHALLPTLLRIANMERELVSFRTERALGIPQLQADLNRRIAEIKARHTEMLPPAPPAPIEIPEELQPKPVTNTGLLSRIAARFGL